MRILKSPQIRFDDKRFIFEFNGESITITLGGISDEFDFSAFPDGVMDSSMVETILEYNPIISAERIDGLLSVKIMNFISEDSIESERFPDWEEY